MTEVNELIDQCIDNLRNELYEVEHDIKRLNIEKETYQKAIIKLETLKDGEIR